MILSGITLEYEEGRISHANDGDRIAFMWKDRDQPFILSSKALFLAMAALRDTRGQFSLPPERETQ